MEQKDILANHPTDPQEEAVPCPHCLHWDWGYSRAVEEMLQASLQSYQHQNQSQGRRSRWTLLTLEPRLLRQRNNTLGVDVVGLSWLTPLSNIAWTMGTVLLEWYSGVVVPIS